MAANLLTMLGLACLVVFCLLAVDVSSSPAQDIFNTINEPKEGRGCSVGGTVYKAGDEWSGPVGECTTNKCHEDGSISGLTCALFAVAPESHCSITPYDMTVQYPFCCPNVTCPEVPPTPVIETLD